MRTNKNYGKNVKVIGVWTYGMQLNEMMLHS